MPKGIGYPDDKKRPFRPTLGEPTPAVRRRNVAATKKERDELLRLRERARVDAAMALPRKGGSRTQPSQPPQTSPGFIGKVQSGREALLGALAPKPPKKRGRR